uniref:Uncharacterized protein n=1 Tax=Cucumis sativus TaxID=3659 RepID=A0A0A0L4Z4_CUCSA
MADAAADQEAGVLDVDNYTKDGTVDWKGNAVLRSKTGRWKACSFILGYELIERMMFNGIAANLIIYLTTKLNQGTLTASNNVTNWTGTVWIMPILGAYVADAHLGRYRTFFISSLVCFMAMSLLTLTVSIPSLKPPPCSTAISKENCKQASKLQHKLPSGSPFIKMANVIVAATWNWRLPLPNDPNQLYELDLQHYSKNGTFKIDSTPSLRFLNKAALRGVSSDPWRICTVTEVEETKQMVRMIPIMVCTFLPSTMVAQSHTLFIKQGTTLDRSIGSHFKVPPASLYAFVTISMLLTILIYDSVNLNLGLNLDLRLSLGLG